MPRKCLKSTSSFIILARPKFIMQQLAKCYQLVCIKWQREDTHGGDSIRGACTEESTVKGNTCVQSMPGFCSLTRALLPWTCVWWFWFTSEQLCSAQLFWTCAVVLTQLYSARTLYLQPLVLRWADIQQAHIRVFLLTVNHTVHCVPMLRASHEHYHVNAATQRNPDPLVFTNLLSEFFISHLWCLLP